MDGHEWNKILGAATGALMVFLSISLFSDALFSHGGHHGEEEPLLYASLEGAAEVVEEEEPEPVDMGALLAAASVADGEAVAKKRCSSCHKYEEGGRGVGPHLYAVVGRPIGGVDGFRYSDVLAGKGQDWTIENLSAFLEDPKGWAPGTKMAFRGLSKPEERASVIAYLNSLSASPLPLQ